MAKKSLEQIADQYNTVDAENRKKIDIIKDLEEKLENYTSREVCYLFVFFFS